MRTGSLARFALFATAFGSAAFSFAAENVSPSGLTDGTDLAAINAAITAASSGDGIVQLAAGEYTLSGVVDLNCAVRIVGADAETTVIKLSGSSARAMNLTHDDAMIESVTFQNCRPTVSGGAVNMSKGTIAGCRFIGCQTKGSSTKGGALYITGGIVTNCLFRECSAQVGYGYTYGGAVYQENGTIVDSRFEGNSGNGTSYDGCLYTSGGTVDRCVFTGHTKVPLFNAGATVKNCLVYGNKCTVKSGWNAFIYLAGVRQTAGKLYNCTIVANTNSNSAVGCAGANISGGIAENNIIIGNPSTAADVGYSATIDEFNNNILDSVSVRGTGNIVGEPVFRDAENGDYHLDYSSIGLRGGKVIAAVTTDLDGCPRPAADPAIGAYEYVPSSTGSLRCRILMDKTGYLPGEIPVAYAIADGAGAEGASISWYLDGSDTAAASGESFVWNNPTDGIHSLSIVVTPQSGSTARCDEADLFEVFGIQTDVYLDPDGGNQFPYNTPARAATNLVTVLTALQPAADVTNTIHVAAGTYSIRQSLEFSTPFRIVGTDAETTVFDYSNNAAGRAFTLSHDDALVEGITIRNSKPTVSGGAVSMSKGTVADCRFVSCQTKGSSTKGGALYITGGTVTNCLFSGCSNPVSYGFTYGAAAYQENGLIADCRFEATSWSGNSYDGCLYTSGGTVDRCVFTGNTKTPLYNTGATVKNCLVYGNTCSAISSWQNNFSTLAGVRQTGGKLYNCTISGNVNSGTATGSAGLYATGGEVINCIVWGNTAADSSNGDYTFGNIKVENNLLGTICVLGTANISSDPLFIDAANDDYRLSFNSPAVRRGQPIAAVTTDITGLPRPAGISDIGAYGFAASDSGTLRCRIIVEADGYSADGEPKAYAVVDGPGADNATIAWYLDGAAAPFGTGSTFDWDAPTSGRHALSVTVTPLNGDPVTCELADAFEVFGLQKELYLDVNGGDTFPYNTPARAARSMSAALSAADFTGSAPVVVHVAAGTYTMQAEIDMRNPLQVIGTNAEVTVLSFQGYSTTRGITMTHADARLDGVTVTKCDNSFNGSSIHMTTGVVANCVISYGVCRVSDSNYGGTAIYITGGVATNCLFTHCSSAPGHGYGNGSAVRQTGGLLTDCQFTANSCGSTGRDSGLQISGGRAERCVFTGNGQTPLYNAGGTVVNCLVYGNSCNSKSSFSLPWLGGVYQSSGKLLNCTIVGNVNSGSAVGCAGLKADGGTVKNTIVWNNPSADGTAAGYSFGNSTTVENNLLDTVTSKGSGNLSADPMFVDAENNDYHLVFGSPAIDHGLEIAEVAVDLDGIARPQRDATDIGCYEYVSTVTELTANIVIGQSVFGPGASATFGSAVDGPDLTGLTYAWYLDGVLQQGTSDSVTIENPSIGSHTLKLIVSTATETKTVEVADAFRVLPVKVYVSLSGSNSFPYDSWQTAATNVNEAFSTLWKAADITNEMEIAAGTYPIAEAMIISTPLKLRGAGIDQTVLRAARSGYRCMQLSAAGTDVSGITISGFTSPVLTGGGIYMTDGYLHDMRVTDCNCTMYDGACGGGIHLKNGTLQNVLVDNCRVIQSHGYAHGDGIYMENGLIEDSVVRGCYNSSYGYGQGIETIAGTVRNCRIEGCYASYAHRDAALYVGTENGGGSAVVENCIVTGSTRESVRLMNGMVRNALIVSNSLNYANSSVLVSGGKMYNCTIADNGKSDAATGDITVSGGTVKNTIGIRASVTGGTTANNCFNEQVAFKRDYQLWGYAENCINKGDNSVWDGIAEPKDLAGVDRIKAGIVDIGCYERSQTGFKLIVK